VQHRDECAKSSQRRQRSKHGKARAERACRHGRDVADARPADRQRRKQTEQQRARLERGGDHGGCAGRGQVNHAATRRFARGDRKPGDRERRDRHQIIALPGRIGTKQKVRGEQGEQRQDRRRPAGRAHQHHDQRGHDGGGEQIECPPRRIAHPADRYDRRVNAIDQRHVDVGKVAIGDEAHQELIGHEMKDRRVAGQRPGQRSPQQPGGDGTKRHVDNRDQLRRGRAGTCCAALHMPIRKFLRVRAQDSEPFCCPDGWRRGRPR